MQNKKNPNPSTPRKKNSKGKTTAILTSAVFATSLLGMGVAPAQAVTADPGPVGDFNWEGLNWKKRTDAGAPMFNGKWNPANVINPDANGDVKLKLTNPTGNSPEAAEMISTKKGFGYGTYTVTATKDLKAMQDEVVWGCMFTYDPNATPGMNEIDLCEASAWGGGGAANWDTTQGHGYWFDAAAGPGAGNTVTTFPVPASASQTHRLVWEPGKLTFYTYAGSSTNAPLAKKTVLTGDKVPVPAKESVHFNLWAVGGNGGDAATVTPEEVTINGFEFIPGAPAYPEVFQSDISAKATELGGRLGAATGPEVTNQRDGGSYQNYEKGRILWSPSTGAHFNWYGIGETWANYGGINGVFAYPKTDEYFFGTSTVQDYQGGSILWSEARGVTTVFGAINGTWRAYDAQAGLGVPLANQVASVSNGAYQKFEKASIYWSPTYGAKVVAGAVGGQYTAAGAEKGALGYPKTAEVRGLKNGGVKQEFVGGNIYWSEASGAWTVKGKVLASWNVKSAENGTLGYPVGNEYAVTGGVAQKFQGGTLTYKTATNSFSIVYN
jgi:hypothetical protein